MAEDSSEEKTEATPPTLAELRAIGLERSSYLNRAKNTDVGATPQPTLETYRSEIAPILSASCHDCHGPDLQEGNVQIDALDPDLFHGEDVSWWLEVFAVLSNGEMPPSDGPELSDDDRAKVIDWLASEIQNASAFRRTEQGHTSFRRMTRYEFRYAMQDLLGLQFDFAKNLPPEPASEDGFQNSSELLRMSTVQFEAYREAARKALKRATVREDRPAPIYWGISMQAASARDFAEQDEELKKTKEKHKDDPEKQTEAIERQRKRFRNRPGGTHYYNPENERVVRASWRYGGARYAWKPTDQAPTIPTDMNIVAVVPTRQKLIVELGNQIPDQGLLRVRVLASRRGVESDNVPSLQLEFGWQASNDSQASVRISQRDLPIDAAPDQPRFYEWEVPLGEIYPRNSVRKTGKMGRTPSPSELLKFVNSSDSKGDIRIHYVEVAAPIYDEWPPHSHRALLPEPSPGLDDVTYARDVLAGFMERAWRRNVKADEIDQKLALFQAIRPTCQDRQEALVEVMATVLASPKFLYLVTREADDPKSDQISSYELATRLSMFLWSSVPDKELAQLASAKELERPDVLRAQVERMLEDERSERLSRHFVRQWLGMDLLDYLRADRKEHPHFDRTLKEAMQEEPIAFFHEVLRNDQSVIDFIHSDFAMVNERLARHYGLGDVRGNDLRRVSLERQHQRGGLLTQAGLLAMNSDGKDSHPLKRGIWMLENLLNDPPPPPPPAVPEIDLTDPEIAKLTLKERIEDHRNHAACRSCHVKIDPWGIAFENYDASGRWRTEIDGKPVDASSLLFNGQKLDGMEGLKRFLLENRQDQFVRAMVHKMTTYALGRPLTFGDRADVDKIAAELREKGDGLATMITLIATSDLFRAK